MHLRQTCPSQPSRIYNKIAINQLAIGIKKIITGQNKNEENIDLVYN